MYLLAKHSSIEFNLNFINVFRLIFSYWVILNGDSCWSVSKDSCSHFIQKIRIDPDTAVQLEHMNKYIVFGATECVVIMPIMDHGQSLYHIFRE